MAITLVAVVIAMSCVVASVRRVQLAAEATALDPGVVRQALRGDGGAALAMWSALEGQIAADPAAEWERNLFEAMRAGATNAARVALVNEQLTELDYRAQRWARVPRVCASVSSTSGFLLASLALRNALESESIDAAAAITGAINVVAVGISGAVFCVVAQSRARAIAARRLAATDALVERVESLENASAEQIGQASVLA